MEDDPNGRRPPLEDYLQILKVEYLNNSCMERNLVLRGKLEENSEEISSVALLNSACLLYFDIIF